MNGYSKIKFGGSSKSRSISIDFSDLQSFPENPKPIDNTSPPDHTPKTQETKDQIISTKDINTNTHESIPEVEEEEEEAGNGQRFGVILSRNSSVSSTASHRFRFEKQGGTLPTSMHSVVKRAFSMRRSSSVSERYCRIHDQSVSLASPIDDDDEGREFEGVESYNEVQARSVKGTKTTKKKHHRTSKILKACKRIFGL